jgi:hypothetical protein
MKNAYTFAGICLALTLVSCGGGGGTASTGVQGIANGTVRIEAVTSPITATVGTIASASGDTPVVLTLTQAYNLQNNQPVQVSGSSTTYYVQTEGFTATTLALYSDPQLTQPVAPSAVFAAGATLVSVAFPPTDQIGPVQCPFNYQYFDPLNFQIGDQVQFQLASYSNGVRTVLPATGWTSTDTGGLSGTLAYDSGDFNMNGAQSQAPQTVTVAYNGALYTAQYDVNPRRARVRGRLLDHLTNAPIANVEIDFYGPSSSGSVQQVGTVITQFDGTFQVSVPAISNSAGNLTTEFTINNATIPEASGTFPGYQRWFLYLGTLYPTGDLTNIPPITDPNTDVPYALESGLQPGNNDLLAVTACTDDSSAPVTVGDVLLYENGESLAMVKKSAKKPATSTKG